MCLLKIPQRRASNLESKFVLVFVEAAKQSDTFVLVDIPSRLRLAFSALAGCDIKTQLETIAKNHQASIQNLETKFDILADKQSGRPSGSLPSNTQPNPKAHNSKAYQPPQSRNEHVNAVFTRSEPYFLPVIISSQLSKEKKNKLISILKKHKQAFAWKTTDIPGICPSFCKHKIQLLDDKKLVVQKQRRLNPNMQEVVKKEIMKLLDTGIIYPIVDSPWVSPIHCVPKKGGITVVTNENDELVPTRSVTGWRVCIDYRKLNEATAKDHFPLPFMDQMLERLAGNKYFCFLDGFSGYFQIPIDPNDQEKTTFIYLILSIFAYQLKLYSHIGIG
ncbi:hypothetical protein Tco_0889082 [Tanacetum coccineum]